jgi:hypothetical protein
MSLLTVIPFSGFHCIIKFVWSKEVPLSGTYTQIKSRLCWNNQLIIRKFYFISLSVISFLVDVAFCFVFRGKIDRWWKDGSGNVDVDFQPSPDTTHRQLKKWLTQPKPVTFVHSNHLTSKKLTWKKGYCELLVITVKIKMIEN